MHAGQKFHSVFHNFFLVCIGRTAGFLLLYRSRGKK